MAARRAPEAPGLRIVGLVDLNEAAARARAAEFRLPHALIGTDLERALAETARNVVFDCAIPASHLPVTATALAPAATCSARSRWPTRLERAQQIVSLAARAKVYAVMQNRRFDPNLLRLQSLIRSGALGAPTTVNSDFYMGVRMGADRFRAGMRHIFCCTIWPSTRLTWGARSPAQIRSASTVMSGTRRVVLPARCLGRLRVRDDRRAPSTPTAAVGAPRFSHHLGELEWRVIGPQGTARWDRAAGIRAQVASGRRPGPGRRGMKNWRPRRERSARRTATAALIQELLRCIREGKRPTICTDNIKSVAMAFAAGRSAEIGQKVSSTGKPGPGWRERRSIARRIDTASTRIWYTSANRICPKNIDRG